MVPVLQTHTTPAELHMAGAARPPGLLEQRLPTTPAPALAAPQLRASMHLLLAPEHQHILALARVHLPGHRAPQLLLPSDIVVEARAGTMPLLLVRIIPHQRLVLMEAPRHPAPRLQHHEVGQIMHPRLAPFMRRRRMLLDTLPSALVSCTMLQPQLQCLLWAVGGRTMLPLRQWEWVFQLHPVRAMMADLDMKKARRALDLVMLGKLCSGLVVS